MGKLLGGALPGVALLCAGCSPPPSWERAARTACDPASFEIPGDGVDSDGDGIEVYTLLTDPTDDSTFGAKNELSTFSLGFDEQTLVFRYEYTIEANAIIWYLDLGVDGGVDNFKRADGYLGAFPAQLTTSTTFDLLTGTFGDQPQYVYTLASANSIDVTAATLCSDRSAYKKDGSAGVAYVKIPWSVALKGATRLTHGGTIRIGGGLRAGDTSPLADWAPNAVSNDPDRLETLLTLDIDVDNDGLPDPEVLEPSTPTPPPPTPTQAPTATEPPTATEAPPATATPSASVPPTGTETPSATEPATSTEAPGPTQPPSPTEAPTDAATPSGTPEATDAPTPTPPATPAPTEPSTAAPSASPTPHDPPTEPTSGTEPDPPTEAASPTSAPAPDETDQDGDGFSRGEDCDDQSADVYPGAAERCGEGEDYDCDGQVDDTCGSASGCGGSEGAQAGGGALLLVGITRWARRSRRRRSGP